MNYVVATLLSCCFSAVVVCFESELGQLRQDGMKTCAFGFVNKEKLKNKKTTGNGDVIATGEGYELGQKIAQNYRDKYSPKSYIVTDPETVASMYELKKLMGKNTNDHDDYPVNISP